MININKKKVVEMKYLIVLSLLLVSCRADISDIMQQVEQEYNLTCISSYEIPQKQIQCFHNSMLTENPNYARCYNGTMHTYSAIRSEIGDFPHQDELRQLTNNIIFKCANESTETTIQALNHCDICTANR